MAKTLSTKPRARRKTVFREIPEIGKAAAVAGFFTIGELAEKVERNHEVVAQVLRGELVAAPTEQLIADAFGISLAKLRRLRSPQAATA